MLSIDGYTATWDDAITQRTKLRAGMLCRVSPSCDAREWDAFRRRLNENSLDISWEKWMPRLKMDVYKLIKTT